MAIDETTASKRPSGGQRLGEVVLDELDARVAGEALARGPEHQLGEVDAHADHLGTIGLQEGEQTPVARAEVEDATSPARHVLEQNALSLERGAGTRPRGRGSGGRARGRPLLAGHVRPFPQLISTHAGKATAAIRRPVASRRPPERAPDKSRGDLLSYVDARLTCVSPGDVMLSWAPSLSWAVLMPALGDLFAA